MYDSNHDVLIDPADYDLSYVFDLKDENGKDIEYTLGNTTNKTDQQKFIKLEDSKVTPQSFKGTGNDISAVGKTPIVRVQVKYNGEGYACNPMLVGFLKLNIVKAKTVASKEIVFEVKDEITDPCKEYTFDFDTEHMNKEVYEGFSTAKEFHASYDFDALVEEKGSVGKVENVDASSIAEGTQNVKWTISAGAILVGHLGQTIHKTARYVSKDGESIISIVFKVKVKRPVIDFADIKAPIGWTDKTIQHTPATPGKDAANCVYPDKVIKTAFNQSNGKIAVKEELGLGDVDFKFTFARHQKFPGITETTADGKTRTVSVFVKKGELNKLWAQETIDGTEKTPVCIAAIKADGTITTYLSDGDAKDLAQELLNHDADFLKARIELSAKKCGMTIPLTGFGGPCHNQFVVRYTRPITFDKENTTHEFYHNVDTDYKANTIHVEDLLNLKDWKTTNNQFRVTDDVDYLKFYGVTKIEIDTEHYKTIPATIGPKLKLEMVATPADYVGDRHTTKKVSGVDVAVNDKIYAALDTLLTKASLRYTHNGVKIDQEFTLVLPVTITYKFGTIKSTVSIKVKPEPASK